MQTLKIKLTLLLCWMVFICHAAPIPVQPRETALSNLLDTTPVVKNIVLVHGAFVNASGWQPVAKILSKAGYNVWVVQHPLTSFKEDLEAVNRTLAKLDGPSILVGHSYGGVLISEAGNAPLVKGLVYIAAHAPDSAEARAQLFAKYPSPYRSLIKASDGFDYIDPSRFAADFAADLRPKDSEFMARSQSYTADRVFGATIGSPAWRKKRSWYLVAGGDRIINPELQRMYAKRASSHTIEVKGASHAVYISAPKAVARLIIAAAKSISATVGKQGS